MSRNHRNYILHQSDGICDSKEFNDCIFKPYVSDCCPDGSDELHCNGMNDILSTYVEFLEDIQTVY